MDVVEYSLGTVASLDDMVCVLCVTRVAEAISDTFLGCAASVM
jgi:hypothetical protein